WAEMESASLRNISARPNPKTGGGKKEKEPWHVSLLVLDVLGVDTALVEGIGGGVDSADAVLFGEIYLVQPQGQEAEELRAPSDTLSLSSLTGPCSQDEPVLQSTPTVTVGQFDMVIPVNTMIVSTPVDTMIVSTPSEGCDTTVLSTPTSQRRVV
ncbi:hypothetical protein LSAT2_016166, partial [Lamellibrachia satsuma]